MDLTYDNIKELLGVVAKLNDFNYNTFNSILLHDDPIINKERINEYDLSKLAYDSHLAACIQTRKAKVLSMQWEIDKGIDEKNYLHEFLNNILNNLDVRKIISNLLDYCLYGFKVLEIYWEPSNGLLIPTNIIGKPSWWFAFDNNLNLIYNRRYYSTSQYIPARKYLLAQNNSDYMNPYGEALLSKCYYPVIFKKGCMQFWATFAQKYGMPQFHATIPLGYNQEQEQKLLSALDGLHQDGIILTKEGINIDTIQSNQAASSAIYSGLINFCNSEISKAILSQTLTTENTSGSGSYAMSQTHADILQSVVDSDKRIVENCFNQLIRYIVNINYGFVDNIPKFFLFNEADVDMNLTQRDALLASFGVAFNKSYFIENYGLKENDFEVIQNTPQTAFSENENEVINNDKISNNNVLDNLDNYSKNIINEILGMIEKNTSFEDIENNLIEWFPNISISEIEDYLAKGILLSTEAGKLSVKNYIDKKTKKSK